MTHSSPPPRVSVVVPTYRRPDSLRVCLRALAAQELEPLEVLVGYQLGDEDTLGVLRSPHADWPRFVRGVELERGANLAASLRACVHESKGDLVALTDDDAEPPAGWLRELAERFTDPDVAAVGGKDLLPGPPPRPANRVGEVQWFGRIIGNHHAAQGSARGVDILKGVNCCFRGDLLRRVGVDERLIGRGNVVHWEMAMCLPLRRAGWRIVYDPALTLDHHVAPRQDGDDNHRGGFNAPALVDMVHNETFLLLDHLPLAKRLAFAVWAALVGGAKSPGVVAALRSIVLQRKPLGHTARLFVTTQRGRLLGWGTHLRRTRRPESPARAEESMR